MADENASPKEESSIQPCASYNALPDKLVLQIADNLGNELGKDGDSDALLGLASLRATSRRNYRRDPQMLVDFPRLRPYIPKRRR